MYAVTRVWWPGWDRFVPPPMTPPTRLRRPSLPWPGARAPDEADLLKRLRARDQAAFEELVARHHAAMVRVAGLYGRDRAVVEEVVQETWLAALSGLEGFEERSSLKTWLFRARSKVRRALEEYLGPGES